MVARTTIIVFIGSSPIIAYQFPIAQFCILFNLGHNGRVVKIPEQRLEERPRSQTKFGVSRPFAKCAKGWGTRRSLPGLKDRLFGKRETDGRGSWSLRSENPALGHPAPRFYDWSDVGHPPPSVDGSHAHMSLSYYHFASVLASYRRVPRNRMAPSEPTKENYGQPQEMRECCLHLPGPRKREILQPPLRGYRKQNGDQLPVPARGLWRQTCVS